MMTKQKEDTPTMAEVEEMAARLEALEQKGEELVAKERSLSQQISEALATGTGDMDALTYERREAREDGEDNIEAVTLLRTRIDERRDQAGVAAAEARMKGIARAFGSLRQELEEDVVKVQAQAAVYRETVLAVNNRFRSLTLLKAEANALRDRFGVAAPTFSPIVLPAQSEGCQKASMTVDGVGFVALQHRPPATEKCEHQLRVRRTYREVNGTPAAKIIEASGGPKPWPALTAKQQEIVDGRERDRRAEAATVAQFGAEAARSITRARLG